LLAHLIEYKTGINFKWLWSLHSSKEERRANSRFWVVDVKP
jgi:hypothetical protein